MLLCIPFIHCFAHLWAFSMSSLTKKGGDHYDCTMTKVIDEARRVQKLFKCTSKAASCLQEHTKLVVMLPGITRWSSNFIYVKRYNEIFYAVKKAFIHPDCLKLHPHMDIAASFRAELTEKLEHLATMNETTQHFQTRYLTLAQAVLAFESVLSQDEDSGFDGIGVDPSYLSFRNPVFENPDFLRGVSKLQNEKAHELN